MKKIRVGITGQSGFIGYHLSCLLSRKSDTVEIVPFQDDYFQHNEKMRDFVSACDSIVHLAAMNRGENNEIYNTNVRLVRILIEALKSTKKNLHVLHASSIQVSRDNAYGKSKNEADRLFSEWAEKNGGKFTGLIIPNVFGAFAKPFYNSVVATFCYQLTHNQNPEIHIDADIPLIYVNDLVEIIFNEIILNDQEVVKKVNVKETAIRRVSSILKQLQNYKNDYLINDVIPELKTDFDLALFNTFRSYLDYSFFPRKLEIRSDERGYLFEQIRTKSSGQTFFSLSHPKIIRGNHYHIRKFERFCVVSGDAIIRLRKIGTNDIITYHVSGQNPSYVDIPILHTHNIENIGTTPLLTLFWSNEFFNKNDSDTFFEKV